MSGDMMTFPEKPEEFIKQYSFTDKERVYTNGSELIPVFRVRQMLEHYTRKPMERIVERLEEKENKYANAKLEFKGTMTEKSYEDRLDSIRYANEIVKEECGINE